MESIIQKINFLKNGNCIFSFFNFWNINLNIIFRFYEIRILISIWVSIKIEKKFEFIEFDCDVNEVLSGYVWTYSMASILNVVSLTNKMDWWERGSDWNVSEAKTWLKTHRWLLSQKL